MTLSVSLYLYESQLSHLKNEVSELTCVLSHFSHAQLFINSMDCSLPGSAVHGILQEKILEWVAMPSTRGVFLVQGLDPSPVAPAGRVCTSSATWEDQVNQTGL